MSTDLPHLDEAECLARLRKEYVGRLGYISEDRPVIVPVNYVVDGDGRVLVRSGEGAKSDAVRAGGILSLQIGGEDELYQRGWSVLVSGPAELLEDPEEIETAGAQSLRTWARSGSRPMLIRLTPNRIEGRLLE